MKRQITRIVIHCSATPPSRDYSAERLRRDHLRRGFSDAGYHYYILRHGKIVSLRPLDRVGAHAQGYNRHSIGICYEGGIGSDGKPRDTRTREQKRSLLTLLVQLRQRFPQAEIVGHRDLSPDRNRDGHVSPNEWLKACPSFDAKNEYRNL